VTRAAAALRAGLWIRGERDGDESAIRRLHEQAFGRPGEADLVDALRAAGGVELSLVAEADGELVGHVLFSPVTIDGAGRDGAFLGLAPMAVAPGRQRSGIGSALVRASLAALTAVGGEAVVVLGHPRYYPRFGFVPASQFGLRWERPCADEAFLAVELRPGALRGLGGGVVRYRPELAAV